MKELVEMTDEELAVSYMNGNNQAFDLLLSRNQSKIFAYILLVFHNNEDIANDIFQNIFVKIIIRLQHRQYSPTGKFAAWCMRIAHNEMMDWFRGQRSNRFIDTLDDHNMNKILSSSMISSSRESEVVNSQVLSDVKRLMHALPAPQREVVYMRYYQNMSFKEIAEATDVSINTALGRMRYAIINMRRLAQQHDVRLALE